MHKILIFFGMLCQSSTIAALISSEEARARQDAESNLSDIRNKFNELDGRATQTQFDLNRLWELLRSMGINLSSYSSSTSSYGQSQSAQPGTMIPPLNLSGTNSTGYDEYGQNYGSTSNSVISGSPQQTIGSGESTVSRALGVSNGSVKKASLPNTLAKFRSEVMRAAVLNELLQIYLLNNSEIRSSLNLSLAGKTVDDELNSLKNDPKKQNLVSALQDMQSNKTVNAQIYASPTVQDQIYNALSNDQNFMINGRSSRRKDAKGQAASVVWRGPNFTAANASERLLAVKSFVDQEVKASLLKINLGSSKAEKFRTTVNQAVAKNKPTTPKTITKSNSSASKSSVKAKQPSTSRSSSGTGKTSTRKPAIKV